MPVPGLQLLRSGGKILSGAPWVPSPGLLRRSGYFGDKGNGKRAASPVAVFEVALGVLVERWATVVLPQMRFVLIRNRHRADTKLASTATRGERRVRRGVGRFFFRCCRAGFCLLMNQSSTILATCL